MTAAFLRANRRTWSSLRRHRNYRLFFAGQVVSVTGTWMQNIAAAWLILELTGSPVAVGLLMLCQFLPFTLLGLFAGVLVDRLDARRLVIGTQASSLVLAAALAAVTLSGIVAPWQVYLLTGLRGVALVLDAPARQALTFQMVGRDELPNAVALNSSLFNAARVIGPAAGGAVIAVSGPGVSFAVNAASFLAVLGGLLLMRVDEFFPLARSGKGPTFLGGTAEAFRYLRQVPLAGVVIGLVFAVSTMSFNFNVLLPVLAQHTLEAGPQVFGIVTACFGAGALAGALATASVGRASPRLLLAGTAGFGLAELALAPQHTLGAVAPLLVLTGFCFTLWTSNANATLQLAAPDHLRGRVIGLYYFAFNGSGPVGGILAGWLAAAGGTGLAFGVAGAGAVAATGLALVALRSAPGSFRLLGEPGTVRA